MTKEEARQVFLSRGYIEVEGGTIYDANKWRESCAAISEWLEQQPCDDVISRAEAIKRFTYNHKGERIPDYDCDNFSVQIDIKTVKKVLRDLPPVTPHPKIGRWIKKRVEGRGIHYGYCSNCDYNVEQRYDFNYCPNCGAKMEVEDNG